MKLVSGRACKIALLFFAGLCAAARAADPPTRYEFAEPHMGTTWKIVLYAPSASAADRAAKAAFAKVEQLNGSFSDYQETSELMKLCQRAGGPPVPVSAELFEILQRSQTLAEQTEGAFDVTVGPLTKLWRRTRRTQLLPTAEVLREATAKVGREKLILDSAARTVRLKVPSMQLDLGGIAKGYAAQAAVDVLRQQGIASALVAGGGDVACSDAPPGQAGWEIALGSFGPGEALPKVRLKNQAISTAGAAEQSVEIAGVRYAHILDPKTGLGLTRDISVTVIAPDGTTADGLDTTLAILGPERGLALLAKYPNAHARIAIRAEGKEAVILSPGFEQFLIANKRE